MFFIFSYYIRCSVCRCIIKYKKDDTKSTEKKDEYVKSNTTQKDSTKQIYKKNTALVNQLKQDAENRKQQLIALVEKSLGNQ